MRIKDKSKQLFRAVKTSNNGTNLVAKPLHMLLAMLGCLVVIHMYSEQTELQRGSESAIVKNSFENMNSGGNESIGNESVDDVNYYKEKQNNNIVYAHVHMAKTGGSTINGWLAAKYERVCGNKGYTYNAYAANARAFEAAKKVDWNKGSGGAWVYNEGEIGYEDCDYISKEAGAGFWGKISRKLNEEYKEAQKEDGVLNTTNMIMELHIPCRDPIDHLLSMANHKASSIKQVKYDCVGFESNDTLLEKEVERGYFDMGRFHNEWLSMNVTSVNKDNIRVKCFNPIPVEPYMAYMDTLLQKRRIPAKYYPHATNPSRNKTNECVHDLPEETKDKIRNILTRKHYYMRFCDQCMGTEQELAL